MTRSPFAGLARVHGRRELLRNLGCAFLVAFAVGLAGGFLMALALLRGRP